jgi:osmotically-inducible protein OsmY
MVMSTFGVLVTLAAPGYAQELRPTDELLEQMVTTALAADPMVESYEIVVTVMEGKVNLHGAVDTDDERARAGSVAADVDGVSEVENEITVERSLVSPDRSDEEILQEIRDTVAKAHPGERVDASVDEGFVTLTGEVSSTDTRRQMTEIAFRAGALLVKNELRVDPEH